MWVPLGALLVLASAAAVLAWRSSGRRRLRERLDARIRRCTAQIGGRELEDGVFEFEGRRFLVEVDTPGLFGGRLGLTVAMFTDRIHEFYLKRAGGLAVHPLPDDEFYRDYSIEGRVGPALLEYLRLPQVRTILKKTMPGRWKTFGKSFLILYLADNEFDSELLDEANLSLALRTLRHLDLEVSDRLRGGAFTFRSGFESDLPPWHWSWDRVEKLPPDITRVVVSYYHENPYLNEGLVEFFEALAGPAHMTWLTDREDLSFLRHSFGDAVRIDGGWVRTERIDVPAAADQYLDGGFFAGLVASDGPPPESLRNRKRFELHESALVELPRLRWYARRLLDDEASWYSGEYEILSLGMDARALASALEKVARKYEARILPLERRFTLKVFKDEQFVSST